MTELLDRSRPPTPAELAEYIGNPLFPALLKHMESAHRARLSVEYSGDKLLEGWNLRFHKGGRTLLRLYPERGGFSVLVVVGRREKERAEALLPGMSQAMRELYAATAEGMGQRWLLARLRQADGLYEDVLALAALRAEGPAPKPKEGKRGFAKKGLEV